MAPKPPREPPGHPLWPLWSCILQVAHVSRHLQSESVFMYVHMPVYVYMCPYMSMYTFMCVFLPFLSEYEVQI